MASRNINVQSPVKWVINSIGFAVRSPAHALYSSCPKGMRQARKTAGFKRNTLHILQSLVILLQIHSTVKIRDLFTVAVEHQGLAPEEFTDAPLRRLAPARVIDFRIHIGVKTVFLRRMRFHAVGGCFSTKRILTMDLMLLKPYFHGTTKRIGAPFCAGRVSP